jgi:hypothetical protein
MEADLRTTEESRQGLRLAVLARCGIERYAAHHPRELFVEAGRVRRIDREAHDVALRDLRGRVLEGGGVLALRDVLDAPPRAHGLSDAAVVGEPTRCHVERRGHARAVEAGDQNDHPIHLAASAANIARSWTVVPSS